LGRKLVAEEWVVGETALNRGSLGEGTEGLVTLLKLSSRFE